MRKKAWMSLLIALVALPPAHAGRIEDAFRQFIDRWRAQGQLVEPLKQALAWQQVRVPELTARVDTLPLGQRQIALFVVPGCFACVEAERYLRDKGMDVELLDLSRSATARDAHALTRAEGLPVVLIGNQRLTGWNERLFKDALVRSVQQQMQSVQGDGA